MRRRHQTGGLKKHRGKWLGQWWSDGKRVAKVLGSVKEMTKGQAREKVAKIVAEENAKRESNRVWKFGEFVELIYFPYYSRKWKESTRQENFQRIKNHLVGPFGDRELSSFRRDELQDLLDEKSSLSFSVVDHLRWDMNQIFEMAVAEGQVAKNPARLLFTPKEAKRPVRKVMTIEEVQKCFSTLGRRERLIAKLAILVGMRPGEIFGLTWGQMSGAYAEIRQRVYRGLVDTPKTNQSYRKAALGAKLLKDIELWKAMAVDTRDEAWVFPSENLTPMSKDNCWRRNMLTALEACGLDWCNFQVMRRTHATLMKALGAEGKLVADQMGHSLDVNQNIYTQSSVESRLDMMNKLEESLLAH
jgi:integrase